MIHPSGQLTYADARGRQVASRLLPGLPARELGTDDPGDWYHFFVTAAMAAHGAAAELTATDRRARQAEEQDPEDRGGALSSRSPALSLHPCSSRNDSPDLEGQMADPTARIPTRRGWVLANALSFPWEGGHYGDSQSDVA
ncbi:hypothetical protein ACRAWF_31470 [Streptomyces sp. L7]